MWLAIPIWPLGTHRGRQEGGLLALVRKMQGGAGGGESEGTRGIVKG